ncbi:MAG: BrnA antitoxin family protein [Terriglobales bacterium]
MEQGRSTSDPWREWREQQRELKRWLRLPKKRVTLNLDADVLAWFRRVGRGYQWEINKALRRVMERERRALNGKH